ncbi:ion transporter [Paenibacillus contaminans]|uniref:Ion transporter n=1 Tax=Paenibacillus contaminans TaxID=450362 RepID=A0A329M405_9BACL|nr:ion transporter [Paenibacillus contaminans]
MPLLRQFLLNLVRMNNVMLFSFTFVLIAISSFLMWFLEPDVFTDPFVGLWWTMTTLTTVGYGDVSPTTVFGRLYAMFLFIVGIGLIGVVIGKVIDILTGFSRRREEGRLQYKGKDHILLIGWSRKTDFALKEIKEFEYPGDVVIIDQLPKSPVDLENVHYIQGDPANDETLLKANLSEARAVILFADPLIEDLSLIDGKTLLIATSIERMAPQVHTTVEVMVEHHIRNFKHVRVNHFLVSGEMISSLAVRSALSEGHSSIVAQLVSRKHGDDLFEMKRRPGWRTYRDAFHALLDEGATLIADGGDLGINRKLDEEIPPEAKLQIICSKEKYAEIVSKR